VWGLLGRVIWLLGSVAYVTFVTVLLLFLAGARED